VTTFGDNDVAVIRRTLRRAAPRLRRPLPWVAHVDPWAILVSEVMLQQTQSSRVVEPWTRFLERFPTPSACAESSVAEVVRYWNGLGYPRRAQYLRLAARQICDDHAGLVPDGWDDLRALPGVGDYTASAVASFAFHRPVAVLDTNVGRVLARAVANRTLAPREARRLAKELLGRCDSAVFNQAMIDVGAQHCRSTPSCEGCPLAGVCRWRREGGDDPAPLSASVSRRQSRFVGSDRQVRGRVLRELGGGPVHRVRLRASFADIETSRYEGVLKTLADDGLVELGTRVRLAGD